MNDTRLSDREWTGVVVALAVLGAMLAVLGAPGYPLAGRTLGTKALPVALIATAVYARTYSEAPWWPLGVLVA